MAQTLQGKVITITGAASGIAKATTIECAARGASLALADLNIDALNTFVTELKSQHPDRDITAAELNIADSKAVDAWVTSVIEHFGRIDGAANIAGVEGKPGVPPYVPIVDISNDHWQFVQDVNLTACFYLVRAQLRVMGQGGSIVNTASTGGIRGAPNLGAYVASKHGVVGLTKTAAKEGGAKGIRANAVCPGPIETDLLRRLLSGQDEYMEGLKHSVALGRLGQPHEIGKIFAWLLSDDSSWVTATTLTADGGSIQA